MTISREPSSICRGAVLGLMSRRFFRSPISAEVDELKLTLRLRGDDATAVLDMSAHSPREIVERVVRREGLSGLHALHFGWKELATLYPQTLSAAIVFRRRSNEPSSELNNNGPFSTHLRIAIEGAASLKTPPTVTIVLRILPDLLSPIDDLSPSSRTKCRLRVSLSGQISEDAEQRSFTWLAETLRASYVSLLEHQRFSSLDSMLDALCHDTVRRREHLRHLLDLKRMEATSEPIDEEGCTSGELRQRRLSVKAVERQQPSATESAQTAKQDDIADPKPAHQDEALPTLIALGSNVGDRLSCIEEACRALDADPDIQIISTSSLYETKAMYVEDQAPFLNGVCEVSATKSILYWSTC